MYKIHIKIELTDMILRNYQNMLIIAIRKFMKAFSLPK